MSSFSNAAAHQAPARALILPLGVATRVLLRPSELPSKMSLRCPRLRLLLLLLSRRCPADRAACRPPLQLRVSPGACRGVQKVSCLDSSHRGS